MYEAEDLDVSVVVPVFNEAGNVKPLAEEIHAALDGRLRFELVFVNDGSRDGTAAEMLGLLHRLPRTRVVNHAGNYGQSAALRTGVQLARARWVASLDGDGQNDPSDVLKLWDVMKSQDTGARTCLLIGHRVLRQDSLLRRLSSRIANSVRGGLLRDRTPDSGCGLKLFPKRAFLELPSFDHMHRFLPALVRQAGGDVVSVEVGHRHRTRGVSKYGVSNRLWAGIIDLMGVMWLARRPCQGRFSELNLYE